MKPFHDWIAEHEAKFEDSSMFKTTQMPHSVLKEIPKELTEWQIRAKMCSLVYPIITTSADVTRWITLFCLKHDDDFYYNSNGDFIFYHTKHLNNLYVRRHNIYINLEAEFEPIIDYDELETYYFMIILYWINKEYKLNIENPSFFHYVNHRQLENI